MTATFSASPSYTVLSLVAGHPIAATSTAAAGQHSHSAAERTTSQTQREVSVLPDTESPVRRLRRKRGLSQRELAERVGMSPHGLARLDRGETRPQHTTAIVLAAALNCKPADLRGDTP